MLMTRDRPNPAPQRRPLNVLDTETPRCPECGRIMSDILLQPGTVNRYKCGNCNTWVYVYVVSAAHGP